MWCTSIEPKKKTLLYICRMSILHCGKGCHWCRWWLYAISSIPRTHKRPHPDVAHSDISTFMNGNQNDAMFLVARHTINMLIHGFLFVLHGIRTHGILRMKNSCYLWWTNKRIRQSSKHSISIIPLATIEVERPKKWGFIPLALQ